MLVDNFFVEFDGVEDEEECLISWVENEGDYFSDEGILSVRSLSHFLLKFFDGVSIEVAEEEGDLVFA